MAKGRVLLCGEVKGQFQKLPKLLDALQQKGAFDFALCIGDFIGAGPRHDPPKQEIVHSIQCGEICGQGDSPTESSRVSSQTILNRLLAAELGDVYTSIKDLSANLPITIYVLDDVLCSYGRLAQHSDDFNKSGNAPSYSENSCLTSSSDSNGGCGQPSLTTTDPKLKGSSNGEESSSPRKVTQLGMAVHCGDPVGNEIKAEDIASTFSKLSTAIPLLPNIYVLPQSGIVDLFGLHIACMAVDFLSSKAPMEPRATDVDEECLFSQVMVEQNSSFRGKVDLLLSNRPPHAMFDVHNDGVESREGTSAKASGYQVLEERGSSFEEISKISRWSVSFLCDFLEPRLHIIAGTNFFWQRPHFKSRFFGYNTRLICLGVVGGKGPLHKAFHALQLTPIQSMLQLLEISPDSSTAHNDGSASISLSCTSAPSGESEAVEEARAALFYVDPHQSSTNPFVSAFSTTERGKEKSRPELCRMVPPFATPIPPPPSNKVSPSPLDSQEHNRAIHGPRRPRNARETGVVLVENLPFSVVEGETLQKAMEIFGEVKFVFVPRDKVDPERGTGKAYVVFRDPSHASKAAEASGQLEGGGRPLHLRLYFDKIPFGDERGAKRQRCGEVISTAPHSDCWFCLANPQCEKHLVVGVCQSLYLVAPKGGVEPLHLLLVPITHVPSLAYANPETREEADEIIKKLRGTYRTKGYDMVVYERYVPMKATKAMHTQVHLMPCSRTDALRAVDLFQKRAKRAGMPLTKLSDGEGITELAEKAPSPLVGYFYIELPGICTSKGQTIERFLYVQSSTSSGLSAAIPMNFGRDIFCELIGDAKKADWRQCVVSREEEEHRVKCMQDMLDWL